MTWPLEASRGAVPVWAAKWCLVGNRPMSPTSPRNLAASTGPTRTAPAGWCCLGDRGLDARLHRGAPLLQLADVGHELGGQLPAGDRRRSGRDHFSEQGGGAVGGEV